MTSNTAGDRLPSSSSSSLLLYKTLLGEVKDYGNSTIPIHLQRRSSDHDDVLVSSVVSLVQGDERRSKKMTKGSIDVAKVKELVEDIPQTFSIGYWRRWYDDLTVLEQVGIFTTITTLLMTPNSNQR